MISNVESLQAINELSGLLNFPCTKLVYVMTDFTGYAFPGTILAIGVLIFSGQLDRVIAILFGAQFQVILVKFVRLRLIYIKKKEFKKLIG